MTRKTIRITRLEDGSVVCSKIGPREPFHQETIPAGTLPAYLRISGMAEPEIETILAALEKNRSAVSSFLPAESATSSSKGRARPAEWEKGRRRLVARMKTAEKAFQSAADEFRAIRTQYGDLKSPESAVVVLRAAKRELAALDRYSRVINEFISFRDC